MKQLTTNIEFCNECPHCALADPVLGGNAYTLRCDLLQLDVGKIGDTNVEPPAACPLPDVPTIVTNP